MSKLTRRNVLAGAGATIRKHSRASRPPGARRMADRSRIHRGRTVNQKNN